MKIPFLLINIDICIGSLKCVDDVGGEGEKGKDLTFLTLR